MSDAAPSIEDQFRLIVRRDPEAWFRHFAVIKDKDGRLVRPVPNILQLRGFAHYRDCQRQQIPCLQAWLKPRQKGASTGCEGIAYHHQRAHETLNGALMGDIQATSDKVFEIYRRYALNDTFPWPDGKRLGGDESKNDDIVLPSGSEYHKETAGSKNAGRSGTVQVCRMTEPAWYQASGETDPVLAFLNSFNDQSSLSYGSADTTPNGPRGWFYETTRSKSTRWKLIFAAWWEFDDSRMMFDSPEAREAFMADLRRDEKEELQKYDRGRGIITPEHLLWRRTTIDDKCGGDVDKFRQEYCSDPFECFLKSSRPKFNVETVARWLEAAKAVHPKRGGMNLQDGAATFVPDENGHTEIFEDPMIGCRYVVSADYATGEDQTQSGETADPDFHAIHVWRSGYLDGATGKTYLPKLVARHSSRVDVDLAAAETVGLSRLYGECMIVPEVNGPGLAAIKRMLELGAYLYERNLTNTTTNEVERSYGWRTDAVTRKTIIDTLAAAVREKALDIPSEAVLEQFQNFVTNKHGRPEALSGKHDDDVLAAAIAIANIGVASRLDPPKRPRYSEERLRRNPRLLFGDGTRLVRLRR